ncbi:hypothetical protein LCGC14_1830740 [marine sediment metagenome]|uniref:Uncharacterized protein n=1 Tax=marine sediment metagenome TaxID=412755 RepID=A0A0F9H4B5_9ZZZZ
MSLNVHNWSRFQHYRSRRPPWIKLHRTLLDDFDFVRLPLASQALAPRLWLLASESEDGSVPSDLQELAFRVRWEPADIIAGVTPLVQAGFLDGSLDASGALAPCKQDATPETETETETETERETENDLVELKPDDPLLDAARELFQYWRHAVGKPGSVWTDKRGRVLIARLREEPGDLAAKLAGLKLAVDGALVDPLHNGTEKGRKLLGFENIFVHQGRDRIEKLQQSAREPPRARAPTTKAERLDAKVSSLLREAQGAPGGELPRGGEGDR